MRPDYDPDKKLKIEYEYIENNLEELVRKYENKFIAVHNQKVIDSDDDEHNLLDRLREIGLKEGPIFIDYIRKKPENPEEFKGHSYFDSPCP